MIGSVRAVGFTIGMASQVAAGLLVALSRSVSRNPSRSTKVWLAKAEKFRRELVSKTRSRGFEA